MTNDPNRNLLLFFDTETTCLPRDGRPHLVQIAAALTDDTGKTCGSINLIVRPEGYEIPAEAAAIHGITTERALREGVPLTAALWAFAHMRGLAHTTIAHNHDFDYLVINENMQKMPPFDYPDWPSKHVCTADWAAPVVNEAPTPAMLAAGRRHAKTPKLSECAKALFGEEHRGAHNALADLRMCMRVYFHLLLVHDPKPAA